MLAILRASDSPPHFLNVRHDDVRRALLQQLGVTPTHVEILTAAYRGGGGVPDIGHGVDIFRRDRFFQPKQPVRFERHGHPFASGGVIAAVHVAGQVHLLGDRLADVLDPTHHAVDFAIACGPIHFVEAGRIVASSRSIFIAVKPWSLIQGSLRSDSAPMGFSMSESQYMRTLSRNLPPRS